MSSISASRTLRARLEKLEQSATGSQARQILVANTRGMSPEEIDVFLAGEGVNVSRNDEIVCILNVYVSGHSDVGRPSMPPAVMGFNPHRAAA